MLIRWFIILLLSWTVAAQAEDKDDRGFIQGMLEDALSGEGRTVTLDGFEGALSSEATIKKISIADADGVWLTLDNVVMSWRRAALLTGSVDIEELSAQHIALPRLPLPTEDDTIESTEVKPFELPDLPVSVKIAKIDAKEVEIGKAVAGADALFAITGALDLADGDGKANLDVKQLDKQANLTLVAGFSNATRELAVDIDLHEAKDGFVGHALNLPDTPSIDLTFKGDAPISDFKGALELATDGTERVSGTLEIASVEVDDPAKDQSKDQAENASTETATETRVGVDLSGDVTPLIPEQYRAFFGTDSQIKAKLIQHPSGGMDLSELAIKSAEVTLDGTASIKADGMPSKFDLKGQLGTGKPVQLPVSGAPIFVDQATINAQFDEAEGEAWTMLFAAKNFTQKDISIDALQLDGGGTIHAEAPRHVKADFDFNATGFAHADEALQEALGHDLKGHAVLSWQENEPLTLSKLIVDGAGIAVDLAGTFGSVSEGLPFKGHVSVAAEDVSRFSALSGQKLGGKVTLEASGRSEILTGAFDIIAIAETHALSIGQENVDRLLKDDATITLNALRDAGGTSVAPLSIEAPGVKAELRGGLNTKQGQFFLTADVDDLSTIEPRLSGVGTVKLRADWNKGQDILLHDFKVVVGANMLEGQGQIWPERTNKPAEGNIHLISSDLSSLARLAGRPLAGEVDLKVQGKGEIDTGYFDVTGEVLSQAVRVGQTYVDRLLKDNATITLNAKRDKTGASVAPLSIETPGARAELRGALNEEHGEIVLTADLDDLSTIEPRVSGVGKVEMQADWNKGQDIRLHDFKVVLGETTLEGQGQLWPDRDGRPVEGNIRLVSPDLSTLSRLVGRPLQGRVDLAMNGKGEIDTRKFNVGGSLTGANLSAGIPDVDKLLRGSIWLRAKVSGSPETIKVDQFEIDTPELDATASGVIGGSTPLTVSARLSDLGLYTPEYSGPLTAQGTIRAAALNANRLDLDLRLNGPGGVTADVSGQVLNGGQRLDLRMQGRAPLGLANTYIKPRSLAGTAAFDLRMNGPASLDSLGGTITTNDTRLAMPKFNMAIQNIQGRITMAAARATIDLKGALNSGGNLSVSGPIALNSPNDANLKIQLDGIKIKDPQLYETKINGALEISGPLARGGRISGDIQLPITEIRVPSSGITSLGAIPEIKHVNEPAAVRASRDRAGLVIKPGDKTDGSGPVFALDLTIDAPNEIFVRGRGLDAELGGKLKLRGTTDNVIPSGQFNLLRGRLDILSKRLELSDGQISLQGDFNAYLRLVAERQVEDTLIQIIIEGLVSDPKVSFESQPSMPQEEVVSMLIFGRGLDQISAFQAIRLAAAVAQLAGKGSGGIMSGLRNATGLADLDVNTDDEGNAQVSAGFYLSDKVYSQIAVDDEGEAEANINLDISKSVRVRGTVKSEGNTGIGIFFEKDY